MSPVGACVGNVTDLFEFPTSESLCFCDDGVVLLVSAFDWRAGGDTDL